MSNPIRLELLRYSSQAESTLGLLFNVTFGREFLCYTLEDEYRKEKVRGETRIPAGAYSITLRREGGHHARYQQQFPYLHQGMLWLRNVPGFEYILIHIGNKDDDTDGCILVGDTAIQNITEPGFIGNSTAAYKRIYASIAPVLAAGGSVIIKIIDHDTINKGM